MAIVTPADITRGWLPLSEDQQADAQLLIDAAVAWLKDPSRRPDIADSDPIAKRILIEVVRSAMSVPAKFAGHTSYSDTMGPWSRSGTVPTPAGTLMFSDAQQDMLGINTRPTPIGGFGDPCGYRYPPPGAVLP